MVMGAVTARTVRPGFESAPAARPQSVTSSPWHGQCVR